MAEIAKFSASFPTTGTPIGGKPGEGAIVKLEVPESDVEQVRTLWREGVQKSFVVTIEEDSRQMFGG